MLDGFFAQIAQALQYTFVQRALLAGSVVAFSCAFLGVFLILRRFSMIGDGLAHSAFASIGLALLLGVYPLSVTMPVAAVASLLIRKLSERAVFGDAAVGMVSAAGMAVGVFLASMGRGFNVDLFSYLFGDILAVTSAEVWGASLLSLVVVLVAVFFYHDLLAVTFDAEYARVVGIRPDRVESVLLVLTAFTVVLGIKVVGTLLVSSLIIFPAVTALQVARGFRSALVLSTVAGVASVILGIFAAYLFDAPAGASIVMVNFVFFALAYTGGRLFRL